MMSSDWPQITPASFRWLVVDRNAILIIWIIKFIGPKTSTFLFSMDCFASFAPRLTYINSFRSFEGGIYKSSRYFAIVLLATWIFFSFKRLAILLSLSGLRGFSSATNFFISARIAVEETSPPLSVDTWLEKVLYSNIPPGVYISVWLLS